MSARHATALRIALDVFMHAINGPLSPWTPNICSIGPWKSDVFYHNDAYLVLIVSNFGHAFVALWKIATRLVRGEIRGADITEQGISNRTPAFSFSSLSVTHVS